MNRAIVLYCLGCPVIKPCSEFAAREKQWGVWGGEIKKGELE